MCPRGNPSALWLVPGHSTSTVPAAPLADPPASAPWRAGAPLAPLSLWPAAPRRLCFTPRHAASGGRQVWGRSVEDPPQGCSGFALGQAGSWHPKSTQSGSGSRGGRTNPLGCPRMTLSHPTDRDPRHRGQFWTDACHLLRASSLAKPCITPAT